MCLLFRPKTFAFSQTKSAAEKTTKRTKKDANAPKRGLSAYMLWLAENRANITEQGMGVTEVAKKAGQLWRAMAAKDKTVRSDWTGDDISSVVPISEVGEGGGEGQRALREGNGRVQEEREVEGDEDRRKKPSVQSSHRFADSFTCTCCCFSFVYVIRHLYDRNTPYYAMVCKLV